MNEPLEAIARALYRACFVDYDPVRAKSEGRAAASRVAPGVDLSDGVREQPEAEALAQAGFLAAMPRRRATERAECAVGPEDCLQRLRQGDECRGVGKGSRLVRPWHASATIRALDAARAPC